jgi:hypothetical protein
MDRYTNFILITNVKDILKNNNNGLYTSLALSHDTLMGDDSVTMCKQTHFGSHSISTIETYYNTKGLTDVLRPLNRSIGLFNIEMSLINQLMICSFTRIKRIDELKDTFFNAHLPYYIMVASGETSNLGSPLYHNNKRYTSRFKQNFESFKLETNSNEIKESNNIYRYPSQCRNEIDCHVLIEWTNISPKIINFKVISNLTNSFGQNDNIWIAFAFSNDKKMVNFDFKVN